MFQILVSIPPPGGGEGGYKTLQPAFEADFLQVTCLGEGAEGVQQKQSIPPAKRVSIKNNPTIPSSGKGVQQNFKTIPSSGKCIQQKQSIPLEGRNGKY